MAALRGLSGAGKFPDNPATNVVVGRPTQIDGYAILGELGRGGMGVVYKAWHDKLHRVVALKMLLGGEFARDDYRLRFRAEAEAFARLQHPNIIQIFDIGEWSAPGAGSPVPYFTLEYVDGGNLGTQMAGNPQPPGWSASWLSTLARAVHHAHCQGIVHRDLKPFNILISPEGVPKVADFGVARWLKSEDHLGHDGDILGTPRYMAPEQANGSLHEVGPAADIYSLGVILYEMLTGRPPHQSTSALETLTLVREKEPVPPREIQPRLSRDLETIVLKCLRKEPTRRYGDAKGLADDIDRYLAGLP
ncbi:serine/threonine-protein kinase, partial [Singulisphaera rosea]